MKKITFIIACVLTIGAACFSAGCHGNQGGPDAENERSYEIKQDGNDSSPEEDTRNDGDAENGKHQESNPEFIFRPHRPYASPDEDAQERETGNDGNEDPSTEKVEPVKPHKMRPHKNKPAPKPMPIKPRR